jgi:hypothetical protein
MDISVLVGPFKRKEEGYLKSRLTVIYLSHFQGSSNSSVEHWEIFSTSHGIATRGVSINENYL